MPTLIIDNYDSFTWNIYADVAVLGGEPIVYRNDEITIERIAEMVADGRVDRIIISPGPGHPRTDSGISRDVITWGLGRVPLLGICMGLECMVDVLGGDIEYAGEIKHGKTSLVEHDAKGIFSDLPALLQSTRYHSLAAKLLTLPKELMVTATTQESGVIMAVRHREFCAEAVQYHPESCMSEGGRGMMANFLKMTGGTWGEGNAWCGVKPRSEAKSNGAPGPSQSNSNGGSSKLPTILEQIHAQRIADVDAVSLIPCSTPANVSRSLSLHASPPQIDFVHRITSPTVGIFAEVKRASPSKGDIAPGASAPEQALRYAHAGASVISVLTEPKWFKGGLPDMLAVRLALDSLPNRPAVLRKDFILAEYQIDEARLYGADTILLIVAMLTPEQLERLYTHAKSRGIEPLVEVNNEAELARALELGARVIGVNNRNLHDFAVDMGTTSRVNAALDGRDVILCALSGISTPEDVQKYVQEGVRAVLVGESLMRATDAGAFLRELISIPAPPPRTAHKPLVKICGIRTPADAQLAIASGADLLGIILVPGTKRCVSTDTAREIALLVQTARAAAPLPPRERAPPTEGWFAFHARALRQRKKPLLIGVFRDQPLEDVLAAVEEIGLDMVQLHGDEPQAWARLLPVPTIKCFRFDTSASDSGSGVVRGGEPTRAGLNQYVLLDAGAGGEGQAFDWGVLDGEGAVGREETEGGRVPFMLAGGLGVGNVAEAARVRGVLGVDVSSGVEGEAGGKVEELVKGFVRGAKGE